MSLGTGSAANPRVGSPLSAGRSSPGVARLRQNDEDVTLKKDKGFRRYSSGVERVLASFDSGIVEWPDYISFLARLQKALAARPAGSTEIAHKALVAKRLSQCLDPGLPSGVHQKAIDVYAYIFQTYGRDGLSANLSIYLPGLSPVLSFASLSVRPNVLSLYEKYIVNLHIEALRPALKALILTFLPALEEASGEDFDRCLQLLDRLRERISEPTNTESDATTPSDQFFWQCLFLACISSATRRAGVLVFLTRRLPVLGQPLQTAGPMSPNLDTPAQQMVESHALEEAIASVASPDPGLLIRCFCAGLRDEQMLVQRGFLDLLTTHLPLHSNVLQQMASTNDFEKLVAAATSVVGRRDMSLNRRLWAWFLGPEPASESVPATVLSPTSPQSMVPPTPKIDSVSDQIRYFEHNGLKPLIGSLKAMISAEAKSPAERTKPFRVCLSLMDRWDIGGLVIPRIFIPALKSAWAYQTIASSKEAQTEVIRSANMFFDSVESALIWSEVFKLIEDALTIRENKVTVSLEKLEFLLFIISKFNVREEEMQVVHMPLVSLYALLQLPSWVSSYLDSSDNQIKAVVTVTLRILLKLVEMIPSRALKSEQAPSHQSPQSEQDLHVQDLISKIQAFYNNNQGGAAEKDLLKSEDIGCWLLWAAVRNTSQALKHCLHFQTQIDLSVSLLGLLVRKTPRKSSNIDEFLKSFRPEEEGGGTKSTDPEDSFAAALSQVSVFETLLTTSHSSKWISARTLRQLIPHLAERLWPGLSPSRLKNNVEAARGLWKLQSASHDPYLVESMIATLMIPALSNSAKELLQLENARRFEVLWMHSPVTATGGDYRRASMPKPKHSPAKSTAYTSELFMLERPLMLMLDALEATRGPLFLFVVNWLQSLPTVVPIFRVLITRLGDQYHQSTGRRFEPIGTTVSVAPEADLETHLYYLQMVSHVLQISSSNIWSSLARPNTLKDISEDADESYFTSIVSIAMSILMIRTGTDVDIQLQLLKLKQCALSLLEQCVLSLLGEKLRGRDIEKCLLEELQRAIQEEQHSLQVAIMDVLFSTLKLTSVSEPTPPPSITDMESRQDSPRPGTETHPTNDKVKPQIPQPSNMPPQLLQCLVLGIRSKSTRPILEHWISFLGHCLPLYRHSVFQILLPLVSCFCSTLEVVLSDLRDIFSTSQNDGGLISEPTMALLLNGLEQTLATAHDQLTAEEANGLPAKSTEPQPTGFFGGMVPGVFGTDTTRSKTSAGNRRLTVLLCFKDAIRIAFQLWSWGDSSKDTALGDMSASLSFSYVTLRLRNRTRRLFEHLFAVEPLECLETLVESWQKIAMEDNAATSSTIPNLLNALESSRPKNAIPAIFNAIYSRTNPTALEPSRKSTLTSEITDTSFAAFLVAYARSLDDDAMDEIWTDCVTFLRDVLANPMPHRQVLSKLVEFTSILGKKAENTNFGEQRRMRRELGDLFNRLLTATLTIRPSAYANEDRGAEDTNPRGSLDVRPVLGAESLVSVLATIGPDLPKILGDSDRLASTANVISTQVILPVFRARAFPENLSVRTLELVKALSSIPEASKPFKRDVGEAFYDSRFFSCPYELIKDNWMPILRSLALADKDRMPDLISRLPYPSTAGLFGVGANSARLEADRKTQLNLRRIALLMLSSADNAFSAHLPTLQQKLVDLIRATPDSSPSSRTRAEVYMTMRAIVLRTTLSQLSSFWPTIYSELADALSSAYALEAATTNNGAASTDGGADTGGDADGAHQQQAPPPVCLLHACKLLDTLLVLGIEDFQLHEWLFIADTTDAMYRPEAYFSVALADDLAEALDAGDEPGAGSGRSFSREDLGGNGREPLLAGDYTRDTPPERLIEAVVRPFLRQLSIQSFEGTYGMHDPDKDACVEDLVADIAAEGTIV